MVVSHGHPDLSAGGAEHAAYSLFEEYRGLAGVEALFVARVRPRPGQATTLGQYAKDGSEVSLSSDTEHFRHSQRHRRLIDQDFRSLLEWFRPSVVHFHHYSHLGLELLREVRNYSPSVPIVLTLHEFLAICNNNGQMVRTYDDRLCSEATPAACHACFPSHSPEDFFLRELFVKSFLSLVDAFISPSHFLIDRYTAWGLPRERFSRIENIVAGVNGTRAPNGEATEFSGRFGFFGSMQPYKGVHVLLEAMSMLPRSLSMGSQRITLDVRGARLDEQTDAYQARIAGLMESVTRTVKMHGPYSRNDIPQLMDAVDWVVVPSTWWENSPLVIQEAFANGVPVIASGIGGMAEQVQEGVNGLRFRVGDSRHLADRMVEAATSKDLRERLLDGLPRVRQADDVAGSHIELYEQLLTASTSPASPTGSRLA
jgi:glycosyltransferase involved in cell wall biosynthesis